MQHQRLHKQQHKGMRAGRPSLLLLAVTAVAAVQLFVHPAAAAATGATSSGRKLLQPFNLGLGDATRANGFTGRMREGRLNRLLNDPLPAQVDTAPAVDDAITARASQNTYGSNLNMGGVAKATHQAATSTDRDGARADTLFDSRSIGEPGFGLTASGGRQASTVLAQRRIAPAGPPGDPEADRPRFAGPNDNRPLGAWEVLTATGQDYGWAGDYDYSLVTAIVDDASFTADQSTYDYDYGQPRPIPETAVITGKTRTDLENNLGRAGAYSSLKSAATAPNAVTRGEVRTVGLFGQTAARQNDDIFGTTPVFIPPNPLRQTGSGAAGAARGTQWKGSLRPSVSANRGNAGNTVSRNYLSGGSSNQLTYAGGTKSAMVRSESVSLGNQENIDFDVGRHRRSLQAHRSRRLH